MITGYILSPNAYEWR